MRCPATASKTQTKAIYRLSPPPHNISRTLNAGSMGRQDWETETLIPTNGGGFNVVPIQNATRGDAQNGLGVGGEVMFTLDQGSQHAVAHSLTRRYNSGEDETGIKTPLVPIVFTQDSQFGGANCNDVCPTLSKCGLSGTMGGAGAEVLSVLPTMQVRRLTPKECERLQGFPDDYTLVPYRKKPAADGPRYKSLGNSMAVPVMRWIGERIKQVEGL